MSLLLNKKLLLLLAITMISSVVLSTKAIAMYQASYRPFGQNSNKTTSKTVMNHQNLALISPVQITKSPLFSFFNTKNISASPTPIKTNSSTSGTAPTTPTPVQSASATAPTATPTPSSALPQQGVYESCNDYDSACLAHLQTLANAGFTSVLNYSLLYATAPQLIAYMDQAQQDGIKVIVTLHDAHFFDGTNVTTYFTALAATCNCSDNTGFTQYVVNLVKNHSALWGYYVGDEISPSLHDVWKAHTDTIQQTDPNHPRLLVLSGSTVNTGFITFADGADYFAQDHYPIFYGSRQSTYQIGMIATALQAIAHQYNKQMGMVLQADSYGEYPSIYSSQCSPFPSCEPYPTVDQMKQMRNYTIANSNPSIILWYSYFDILGSDDPTLRWNNLINAAFAPYP